MKTVQKIKRKRGTLEGVRVLVTAGPTVEDIDPVRFISNRSSGRMGVAVARAAAAMGARVMLVHGPLSVAAPRHTRIRCVAVRSAREMCDVVMRLAPQNRVVIMAAAVADFTPTRRASQKIKKTGRAEWSLRLKRTPDILAALGKLKKRPFLVGFAAETKQLLKEARRKLIEKGCDLVCANDVSEKGSGFEVPTNRVLILDALGNVEHWPRMSKMAVAGRLLRLIQTKLEAHSGGTQ